MPDASTLQLSLSDAMQTALQLAEAGNLEGARSLYTDILASDPRNPTVLMNLGVILMRLGEPDPGIGYLERALAAAPQDETTRNNLRHAYEQQLSRALADDDKPAAVAALRNIFRLGGSAVHLRTNFESLLAYAEMRAELSDYEGDLTPDQLGHTILIACMPKSGSSWLVNCMCALSGYPIASLANAHVENDQDLYSPVVQGRARDSKVVHQHCRATANTLHLVQAYEMRPVVLVRNLADTLVSMRDFWKHGAVRNSFFYGDWEQLDEEAKHDALIRHLGPWYIQFYVSWVLAERKGDAAPHWVRYEDMMSDKPGTVREVAEFCGLSVRDQDIASAISRTDSSRGKTRFNRGVAGRGAETFTAEQLAYLRELTHPFPSIDFSPLGL